MKQGNKSALARWDDVYPIALKEYLASLPEQARKQIAIVGDAASAPDIRTTLKANGADVEGKNEHGSLPSPSANTNSVFAGQEETVTRNLPLRRGKRTASHVQGILPGIVASLETKDDTAAYEALKQAGYIHSAAEPI